MTMIKRVLLVDDEPDIRMIAAISLERLGGWEVVAVGSGREALTEAQARRPDLILLDVMMPDMDGTATFGELQQLPETRDIPVIFLTAKVQPQEVSRYLSLGACGVIRKPFDPLSLPDRIRSIVEVE